MQPRRTYTARERRIRSEKLMRTYAAVLIGGLLIAGVANTFGRVAKQSPAAERAVPTNVIKAGLHPN